METKIIGVRKYQELKKFDFDNMTEESLDLFGQTFKMTVGEAIKLIEEYERVYGTIKLNNTAKEYWENLGNNRDKKERPKLTKEILWKRVVNEFQNNEGIALIQTPDVLENLKPLIYYFVGDFENFKKCQNVSDKSELSQDKGLLIVGNYGNGKTSVMKAFESALKNTNIPFRGYSANQVVLMFEGCDSASKKDGFFNLLTRGVRYFDDVKTEREASNYGKTELFKEIIEMRYSKKARTYITCNFNDQFPNDLDQALEDFGKRYGSRVYDRIFEMFNIITFTGPSFRK